MFREGSQIGLYTLVRKLGKGGFGEVWLAERRAKFVTTKVAVKLPLDEQIDHEAIKQEAMLWEQASGHPNILPIIDADEYDGQIVIVSEYAPDGSLDEWLKKHGAMPAQKAIETTIKILDGLEFLHSRNIIHRDLKPANILLQSETPRLADFGISRALRTTASSQSSNVSGTFAYMPPEGFDGKRSVQTDVWSVGVNLYQFLTGTLPFPQKEPSQLIAAIMMCEFEPLPDSIPQNLQNVIAKALTKQPESRYDSASEMREDLRRILRGEIVFSTKQSNPSQTIPLIEETLPTVETVIKIRNKKSDYSNSGFQNFNDYVLPKSEFLTPAQPFNEQKEDELLAAAQEIVRKLREFNVTGTIIHISPGPIVTTYEFKPASGVKYSRITSLADDLCLALKAESIRIDRIPGKAHVGIEVPNPNRDTIFLREVIESTKFQKMESKLSIALGKSIDGLNYVADLAKMPHLFIVGTIGSGKSVCINAFVISILYKAKPDEVKFILIDTKRIELGLYENIPHLATPIIIDPKRASNSLKWAVAQMEKRYKDLAGWGVRNIDGYNAEVEKRNAAEHFDDNGEAWKKLPFIVIIIDELADLMMVGGKEVEESITLLAQKGHTVGIHLVIATQRTSSNVFSGLTKENFPSRISFRVLSKGDSRTIINTDGAEQLLGDGDMLFLPPNTKEFVHVHGAFVDEKEIYRVVEHIKEQGKPEYEVNIDKTNEEICSDDLPGKNDPLFTDALNVVVTNRSASTSLLQRHLRIGYGRAAAILNAMVREEYVGEIDANTRSRPILEKAYNFLSEIKRDTIIHPNLPNNYKNLAKSEESKVSLLINQEKENQLQREKTVDSNKTENNGCVTLIFIISLLITLLLMGMSFSYCESSKSLSKANYNNGGFEALVGILCLVGSVITGFTTLLFGVMMTSDENTFAQSANNYPIKTTKNKTGRQGRSINLFGRSKKSSIVKSVKRSIKKYGD